MSRRLLILAALLFTVPAGCAHVLPVLGAVLSRVDVGTVIRCASKPSRDERRACLGLRVAAPAVDEALLRAAEVAERAREAAGPAGAGDYTDHERRQLAGELDGALRDLEIEISRAHDAAAY